MRDDARVFLVAVAAAGLLGAVSVPIAATAPTTTWPAPPTGTSGSSGISPTPSGSPDTVPEPTLRVPPTAQRGTQITIYGDYWPCDAVSVSPNWSDSVTTAYVHQYSFDAPVSVPDRTELGAHSINVTCRATYDHVIRREASIKIVPAQVGPTTTTTTSKPTTTEPTTTPVTQPPTTQPPTAAPRSDDRQRDNHIGDALGIGGFLLAVGVATLVLHQRRKHPTDPARAYRRDPHPPQVCVHVVEDMSPSIYIRQITRPTHAPAVRVRLSGGEPQLHVREVPR
ncbi:hypothetical protein [Nocardia sp. NBC_00403]|uniref:hypothetical protein n=1 Tax=Nocardia sp. NBC_00403 TaxID=2975990 RepID=UPI002E22DABA